MASIWSKIIASSLMALISVLLVQALKNHEPSHHGHHDGPQPLKCEPNRTSPPLSGFCDVFCHSNGDIVSTLDSVVERPWLTHDFISCQAYTGSSRTYGQTPYSRSSAWAVASKDASPPDLAECTGFIFFSSRSLSTFSNCESQPHMRPWN